MVNIRGKQPTASGCNDGHRLQCRRGWPLSPKYGLSSPPFGLSRRTRWTPCFECVQRRMTTQSMPVRRPGVFKHVCCRKRKRQWRRLAFLGCACLQSRRLATTQREGRNASRRSKKGARPDGTPQRCQPKERVAVRRKAVGSGRPHPTACPNDAKQAASNYMGLHVACCHSLVILCPRPRTQSWQWCCG